MCKSSRGAEIEKLTRKLWEFSEQVRLEPLSRVEDTGGPGMSKRAMIVAGVMSGTSADGINVPWSVSVAGSARTARPPGAAVHIKLLGHAEYSYPSKVRAAVLAAMNATNASVADLSRLNFLLGELYADAVLATQRRFRVKVDLVGCHGQTLYHQGDARPFLGRKIFATWQTGEGAVIAARVGVPVVSDFRPADMAAGGKGAPLVPYLDYLWFRDPKVGRIVQNIGGIANSDRDPRRRKSSRNIRIRYRTGKHGDRCCLRTSVRPRITIAAGRSRRREA